MKFKTAFASNDGKNLVNSHFGDAETFYVYEISENSADFLETVKNTSPEEKKHGDPNKAKGISSILKGTQILVSKQFGKNIVRMKKNFLPVLVNVDTIEQAIPVLQKNFDKITEEWNNGENRNHLTFRI